MADEFDTLGDGIGKLPAVQKAAAPASLSSSQKAKFLDRVVKLRMQTPDEQDVVCTAKHFIVATLPHKDPGDIPAWQRSNGRYSLVIRPGWNHEQRKPYGYPYGTLPRLLLYWIVTEALETASPYLELGPSLAAFMRNLGLNTDNGTGKRSDSRRLREQMERLFQSTISFHQTMAAEGQKGKAWLNMAVAPQGVLWWSDKSPEQSSLFKSWIRLSEEFFQSIFDAPVPVDLGVLKALKGSALALDLYAWAVYTVDQANRSGKPRFVAWQLLHDQLGAEYAEVRNFRTKANKALAEIQAAWPALRIGSAQGGIQILPGTPAVPYKARRRKLNPNLPPADDQPPHTPLKPKA